MPARQTPYPSVDKLRQLVEELKLYGDLKHEHGAPDVNDVVMKAEQHLAECLDQVRCLSINEELAAREPSDYEGILALRPKGPRRLWESLDEDVYTEKLEGAFLARCAGCSLGAPVEAWPIEKMEVLAKENGDTFPPEDYWSYVYEPHGERYNVATIGDFTRGRMNAVPADDDIGYTLVGLLALEESGPGLSTADIGAAWQKYLPIACTAEDVALRNLKNGVPAEKAAEIDNPYLDWIGADIRSDPWAYAAPGWPEKAAALAWRDASLSHRRNGVFGAMFFSAAISAAFAVDDPEEALRIGLTEIPADCTLAREVKWALETAKNLGDYRDARAALDTRFRGMSIIHTVNNACATIFALKIGNMDVTKTISTAVAIGLDNDCTAATAGSLIGAIVGRKGVPPHWYRPFNGMVKSYLIGQEDFRIDDLVKRFAVQAKRVYTG